MTKVHVPLLNDEYNMLHQMASQELRLPEQMVRWLIREEAARRELWKPSASTTQPIVANRPTPEHI